MGMLRTYGCAGAFEAVLCIYECVCRHLVHGTASLSQSCLGNTHLTVHICVCRAPLSEKDLVDDTELKAKIDMWKQQRSST